MAPPLLQLKDIALTFGGTPLLEGAELSVSTGERVSLVGRNGSGKSTLLKIAAGLIEPDRGSVFVQPGALVRYLPQEPDFSGFASTLSYVEAGLRPNDDTHAARYLLEQGLSGEKLSHISRRSASRRSRVLASPDILLLDEPTNHLDLTTIDGSSATSIAAYGTGDYQPRPARFSTLRSTVWLDQDARAVSNAGLRISRNGAMLLAERAEQQSSTARSLRRSIGCAMASPADVNEMCAGSASCKRCENSAAPTKPPLATP